ncbi:MAG: PAS domain S-box protein [Deltaproteobacteria bacterium]|nr:PAS domain S-box protein [Deltaproteobacteria bacterium]
MTGLRVLLAEDSEDDSVFLALELRKGGFDPELLRVDNEDDLMRALEKPWDIVITDYNMPRLTGLEVIRHVHESGHDIPIIVISGVMGEEFAVTAMKAGAHDYMLKGNMPRLVPAIHREMKEANLRKAHRLAEEEVLFLNKLLKTISQIDQLIIRAGDKDCLLKEACRILANEGGFELAWIGMADFEKGTVTPVAYSGIESGYMELVNVRCDDSNEGNGPTGQAIRTGKNVICKDIENNEEFASWFKLPVEFGYKVFASFPLFVNGSVIGNMNVYSKNRIALREKMVRLLGKLASDIGFALQKLKEAGEHRKAIQSLRDSEEMLRTIFESAMDGMFVIDKGGRYIDVNFAGCHMFGYNRDEFLSTDVNLLVFPEDRGRVEKNREFWTKGFFLPELRMRKKDGSEIWVDMTITPFRVGDKDLALGVKRDITDRKRAEEALRESEERFRLLFERNADAQIIFKYRSGEVIDANPAAVSLFGITKEELPASTYLQFSSLRELEKFKDAIAAIKEGEGFTIPKAENITKDGRKIIASITGQVVRLKQSKVVYCTVRDITEKIRMEDEARFIQAKLIHANKMTSIGTLASGVAHEINNPNNFILFNSTLLTDAWKDAIGILNEFYKSNGDFTIGGLPFSEMAEVIPELLSGITDGSRRIKGIVDSLKDFSRVDRAGLEGEFDVNRAVLAASSILNNQICKYTEGYFVKCAEWLPPVKGSSQKIEQVLINLIINALHALPNKESRIWVGTSYDAENRNVIVNIKDEGTGMSRDVLERITEPFFTTKIDTGGTGLGLSISYTIVKEHKGSLEFSSEQGKGTTVTMRLPAKISSAEQEKLN